MDRQREMKSFKTRQEKETVVLNERVREIERLIKRERETMTVIVRERKQKKEPCMKSMC